MSAIRNELLKGVFARCEALGASDIHLAVGQAPRFRIAGRLVAAVDEYSPFGEREVDAIAAELGLATLPIGCGDGEERVRLTLLREGSVDGAISSDGGARYRFNLFRENGRTAVALRRLNSTFRSLEELGLPAKAKDFTTLNDGLVIVTGPTGSGKSTTLATMVNDINRTREAHIITIEDPIEYLHGSDRSLVAQRQVGRDSKGFNEALVEALRQDPDVILIGELRDLQTVRTAIRAAETGHLVFATLHSGDCAGAIERLVSVYPAEEQAGARRQLALCLRGILAQHLVRDVTGGSRVAVCELMVNTSAAANIIAQGKSAQLYSVMETGASLGMRTVDESLVELLKAGRISEATAAALSRNPSAVLARAQNGFLA